MFTCERSPLEPSYFIIRKPDGRMWRVCHESRIQARMQQLNQEN